MPMSAMTRGAVLIHWDYPALWCSTLIVMGMDYLVMEDYLVVEDFLDTAGFHIHLIMALQQPTGHGAIIHSWITFQFRGR